MRYGHNACGRASLFESLQAVTDAHKSQALSTPEGTHHDMVAARLMELPKGLSRVSHCASREQPGGNTKSSSTLVVACCVRLLTALSNTCLLALLTNILPSSAACTLHSRARVGFLQ